MALTRIKSSNIADETVVAADIADGSITDAKIQTGVSSSKLTGNLPAISGASLTNLTAANISGALPAIDGSNLTGVSTDTSVLENNIAILAFKTQSANNLAKFNLIDQVIDEYYDTSGIDASASTNELLSGSGTAKYYEGGASVTPTATGGTITTDGDYTIHTITASGDYVNNTAQSVEYLVVGGGGGGGRARGGGGGGGGFRFGTGFSMTAATHAITVGLGGAGGLTSGTAGSYANGQRGGNSVLSTITSTGGGGGVGEGMTDATQYTGGSGGGGCGSTLLTGGAGNTPSTSPSQGYAGGTAQYAGGNYPAGGGGGAGAVGGNASGNNTGGNGGAGASNSISGAAVLYAGGGGGGTYNGGTSGTGGTGGGGAAAVSPVQGTDGLGGGGGGSEFSGGAVVGADGGNGVVIIRRLTTDTGVGANLTLQSVANTALSAPTTGDVVMLIENAQGTATLNTDIKAWVSRNGGTGWDQATLVDKGTWGTNKKIVSANNVAFSNSASGTDMRYKITTHNQSAGSKETRIHATSLAWA